MFAGIARSEEEFPSRLFEAFELRADDLERAVIFGVLGRGGGFFRRLFLSHVFDLKRPEKLGASDPVRILVFKAVELEAHHKATVSFVAIKTAAWVAENYAHDKLPSSLALELMRKAFVSAEERGDARVEPDHVIATAEEDLKTSVRAPVHRN